MKKATWLEIEFKESYTLKQSNQTYLEKRKKLPNAQINKLIDECFAAMSNDHDSLKAKNDLFKFKEGCPLSRISLLEGLRVTESEEIVALHKDNLEM